MLNYLEQGALYNACNFMIPPVTGQALSYGSSGLTNQTVWTTTLVGFLCPSDVNAGNGPAIQNGKPNMNNYHGNGGTTSLSYNATTSGVFAWQYCYGIRDITDGTSSTIAFMEALVGDPINLPTRRTNSAMTVAAVVGYGDVSTNPTGAVADLNACTTSYLAGTTNDNSVGAVWAVGSVGLTMITPIVPPNSLQYPWGGCKKTGGGWSEGLSYFNPSSRHSGGVNTLFCDGSVKFIKDGINMQILWAIATRGNNEAVSQDSF
jgi:prepilin-type processing-associated H-X9-DG protein